MASASDALVAPVPPFAIGSGLVPARNALSALEKLGGAALTLNSSTETSGLVGEPDAAVRTYL